MSATTARSRSRDKSASKSSTRRPRRARAAYRDTKREAGEDFGALGRPVWSGSISFGLVNIPIRLHTAVREHRIAFHQLHDQDKMRLRRRFVSATTGREIHPEHLVRGYEFEKDQYVVIRDEELEACAPEKTKAIEITDFVKLRDIDPLYFDRPYYVIPQSGATKSYRLLAEAMTRAERVGLARIVMHEKERLAALRPVDGLLCLETMHFADEIVPQEEGRRQEAKLNDRELKAAQAIIKELAGPFRPGDFRDTYRECVREMLKKKAKGDNVVDASSEDREEPAEQKPARSASNLMAALEASLAKAKAHTPGRDGGRRAKRRKGE
jgi:DNA end-binding protein Ku